MSEELEVAPGITIPGDDLTWHAVRASGPGGQNVNKVSSKVELRFDLLNSTALDDAVKDRLRKAARRRLDAEGRIVVVSQKTRDRERNLDDARERLRQLIADALVAPRARRATKPSRAQKRRRLEDKKRHGKKKRDRSATE